MKRKERGFTLLELLMVVIILGILASVALPQYIRTSERSRAAEALNMLATLRQSQLRYYAQQVAFTNSLADLDVEIPPAGKSWNFTTDAACGEATRIGTNKEIRINLKSGAVCTDDAATYGQVACPVSANC
jgi:prepilin-type N-terminal cleavage/methylation domain-containing protein